MNISYSQPLSRGWDKMKEALFQPFDIAKWFTVGFTAFLAGLTNSNGGSNGANKYTKDKFDWDDFFNLPQTIGDWLHSHSGWTALIISGVILLIALIIVFQWLSSRGKFMFLYNVTNNAAEVKKPWHEYRELGNSLFLWRLVFGWLCIMIIGGFFYYSFDVARSMYYAGTDKLEIIWNMAGRGVIFIAIILIIIYISIFLNDFVVPIMAKDNLKATPAWYKFMMLFYKHSGSFIIYGLFIVALGICVGICVVIIGLLTCCIGFILLALPYIGSVIFLPVSYTYRALSLEFLAQFGDEYNIWVNEDELSQTSDYQTTER